MGSFQAEDGEKKDLDDSGYVQDEVSPKQTTDDSKCTQLLDLSDDVLLCILRHCTPRDLKALGYSCVRLGALIRDRSLWHRVDGRGVPYGRIRLRWLLAHALNSTTSELHLTGFAQQTKGCLGHVNRNRKDVEDDKDHHDDCQESDRAEPSASTSQSQGRRKSVFTLSDNCVRRRLDIGHGRHVHSVSTYIHCQGVIGSSSPSELKATSIAYGATCQLANEALANEKESRLSGSPCWPENEPQVSSTADQVTGTCPGPQFTLTPCMMKQLRSQCNLTSLSLEYVNINCKTININLFPASLKELSLRGAKCFNLPLDKSFLFKIQDSLPLLESIDVSECEWMEPASLLPLSKMEKLQTLRLRDCYRLSEFVAYASLSTRYGFRKLKYLDLRGSPLGDSEVTALGWLPLLEELYLSAPVPFNDTSATEHTHYKDDVLPPSCELDDWEMQEPSYFKINVKHRKSKGNNRHPNEHDEHRCYHGLEYNQCLEGFGNNNTSEKYEDHSETENDLKRKNDDNYDTDESDTKPGPSKRIKTDKESSQKKPSSSEESDDSSDDDDDVVPTKKSRPKGTSDGEVTSQNQSESQENQNGELNSSSQNPQTKSKKKKRRSQSEETRRSDANNDVPEQRQRNRFLRPSAHVLYVNVGQQLHTVYRLAIPNEPGGGLHVINNVRAGNNLGHILYAPLTSHIDASILVTDSAVRGFGHSDDCVNYFHIGPPGPQPEGSHRPTKSNLRVLSVTGYRNITNRSLEHLATAAPRLRVLNFSETRVTSDGVEAFKALRPDVEVIFSEFKEREE